MQKWYRFVALAIGVAALATALGGCGSTATSSGKTICLATDFPVSGTDASEGLPAQYGVQLAVNQNKDLGGGNTLELRTFDDVTAQAQGADPNQGAQNVQTMINTGCIVSMVGPFNSGVAAAEMPIASQNGLAMISPSNTN